MGQTLTHGIYLPDKGERNCYNGLAANWQILDNSVGTIAAHTSALAGKAPLVHTHTKSDITDFPAYGTTAGTICEGNDSRLSDARTPVAHSHLTADVTDLLNSAHTWTGANTFQGGGIRVKDTTVVSAGGYGSALYFYDYQGNRYGYIQPYVTSDNYKNIIIGADGTGRVQFNSDLIPYSANAVNLGNSTLKWKTLNGINPGALSLPKVDGWNSGTELTAAVGVDTTNWDMSGGTWNEMTNNIQDGWVFFAFQGCSTGDRALVRYYGTNARYLTMGFNAVGSSGGGYYLYVAFPMAKGSTVNIAFATSGSVMSKFIYPCMGNV